MPSSPANHDATPASAQRPRRVAIVGAGPAGLFAAQALLKELGDGVRVDILDRLPTPFGLLRYGVAPDHESIKSVAIALARVFESRQVRFLGLVEFGRDVSRECLLRAYDAIIYAAGSNEDLRLNVPGEELPGSRSAREFVAWYSGHPDAVGQSLAGVHTVALIGVGNVAVDCARILLKAHDDLADTDMPEPVLTKLSQSTVADVWLIARRGPAEAAFTTTELRELLTLDGVAVEIIDARLDDIDRSALDRRQRANVDALDAARRKQAAPARATVHMLFWHRPVAYEGRDHLTGVLLEGTRMAEDSALVGNGSRLTIPADLVLRAIGYAGKPLSGVPFDPRRAVIPNIAGRVVDADGVPRPGEYVAGWIKRGPVGVIGTNKPDAAETVRSVVDDFTHTPFRPLVDVSDVLGELRPTSFEDWRRIDAAEIARGDSLGRPRAKIEQWHELVRLARHEDAGS